MKYTQEQLEAMSDFEINKLVAEKEGLFNIKPYCGESYVLYEDIDMDTLMYYEGSVDYCNSWADMGPVLGCLPIFVEFSGVAWSVEGDNDVYSNFVKCEGRSARAAAIVYLLMEGL